MPVWCMWWSDTIQLCLLMHASHVHSAAGAGRPRGPIHRVDQVRLREAGQHLWYHHRGKHQPCFAPVASDLHLLVCEQPSSSTAPPGQQCLAVLTQSPHMSQVSATKKGYKLPRSLLTNSDLTRLINSDEIQSVVNAPKVQTVLRSVICNVGFTTVLSTAGVLRKVAGLAPFVHTSICHPPLLCPSADAPAHARAPEEEPAEEPGRAAQAEPVRQDGAPPAAGPRGAAPAVCLSAIVPHTT